MTHSVRAKAYIASTQGYDASGKGTGPFFVNIILGGVYKDSGDGTGKNAVEENRIFGEATPLLTVQMTIANPDAASFFEEGKEYYIDFTAAEVTS